MGVQQWTRQAGNPTSGCRHCRLLTATGLKSSCRVEANTRKMSKKVLKWDNITENFEPPLLWMVQGSEVKRLKAVGYEIWRFWEILGDSESFFDPSFWLPRVTQRQLHWWPQLWQWRVFCRASANQNMAGGSWWVLVTVIMLGIHRDWCQVTMCLLNFSIHSYLVNFVAPLYRWVKRALNLQIGIAMQKGEASSIYRVQVSLISHSL